MTDPKPPSERDEPHEQEKWYERTRYQVFLFAGGIALFVIAGALILNWYIDPHTSTQKQALVQALGLITAGVAGAVGIIFTWRGQRLARETQEHNQKNTQEQLRLAQQGQITERFTRAIDQLGATDDKGDKKLEIRLGGIYALERIDKESPERAYHRTVIEVLTAYVRENSRRDHGKSSRPISVSNEEAEQDRGAEQDAEPSLQTPPTDIQAILDVLNRRQQGGIPRDRVHHLELQGSVLPRAQLQKADLQGATLQEGQLQGAGLENAKLQGAKLQGAKLQGAQLRGAFLQGARLQGARLRGANLYRADLRAADLQGANLQGANLQGADLRGAVHLTQEQIEWTIGSEETPLTEGLHPPALWRKSIEKQVQIVQDHLDGAN